MGTTSLRSAQARGHVGWLLAMLALVSQLALGAMVLPDRSADATDSGLQAIGVLCRSGAPAHPAPHRQTGHSVCPISLALALPGVTLSPGTRLPAPILRHVRTMAIIAAARGPPVRVAASFYARGPPRLS